MVPHGDLEDYFGDPSLNDHQKKGKILLAPVSQLPSGKLTLSRWHIERLPELIWISELLEAHKPQVVIDLLCHFLALGQKVSNSKGHSKPLFAFWWKRKTQIRDILLPAIKKEERDILTSGLSTLASLYPQYPVCNFLKITNKKISKKQLSKYKERLAELINRFSARSVSLHGAIAISMITSGHIKIASHIELPDINVVFDGDTENEEYKAAAGFCRSMAMSIIPFIDNEVELTSSYFWNRGKKLEKCSLPSYKSWFDRERD